MPVVFNIDVASVRSIAVRNIDVFAKRYSVQGENKFTFVALSSAEEVLVSDFISKAAHDVVAQLAQFSGTTAETESQITITFSNTRWGDDNTSPWRLSLEKSISDYLVSSAVADYFGLYFPQQSQHYKSRASEIMANIVRLAAIKNPPDVSNRSYSDVILT